MQAAHFFWPSELDRKNEVRLVRAKEVGGFLIVGGIVILAGILVAQSLYPGYDPSKSAISDLGAPVELAYDQSPGVLSIEQPASIVFISSFLLGTIFIIQAARLSPDTGNERWFRRFLTLFGAGALLVVLSYVPYYAYSGQWIPGSYASDPSAVIAGALVHLVGAVMIFIFGGLAAVASYRFLRRPASFLPMVTGLIIIAAFLLNLGRVDLGLGNGGIERLAAYSLFLWMAGLGVYLRFYKKVN